MPTFQLPLSSVNQTINPWTWMTQLVGNQFGVNINLGKSTEPAVERLILDEVGSYGRQLGRIGDALLVLMKKVRDPSHEFSDENKKVLDRLVFQIEEIDAIKAKFARDAAMRQR
jgi:hypothetical protein